MASSAATPLHSLRRSDPPPKPTGERATFLAEVVAGLRQTPKTLPAQYMFDAVGTRLFGCLAATEEHYLVRTERALLEKHAAEIASFASATRPVAHVPSVNIGALSPRDARSELQRLATECGPGGGLVVGLDLKKEGAVLESAYDDRAGVAAAFGLNLLARINRELVGSFQLAAFDHRAIYDAEKGRVEIQLVSKRWQWAAVHGDWFNLGAGETITTLVAYKYTVEWFTSLAASAGWKVDRTFLDHDRDYAVMLLAT